MLAGAQRFQRGQHPRRQRVESHHPQQGIALTQRDTGTVMHQQIRPMHVPQQTIEGVWQVAVQRETMYPRVLGDRLEPRVLRQREASPAHLGRQAVGGQWQQLVTLGQVAHQGRRLTGQLLHDRGQQTRPWQRSPLAALF